MKGQTKRLFEVCYTYGEHEMESDVYAGELGTIKEGREYLMHIHTDDDGTGYMQDAIEDPSLLTVESVRELTWVVDKVGNPHKVGLL